MSAPDVTAIRQGHEFDERNLADYLARHLEGFRPPLTVRQFRGGQSNPTFLLDTGNGRYVLR
jgi:aminoglycoside phosphotransferase (APT) family kinase protein